MAEESFTESITPPILPSFSEIESIQDPMAGLKTPVIETPEFSMPQVSGVPMQLNANQQLQGDYHTGPNPGVKKQNMQGGTLDYIKGISEAMSNTDTVKDRYKYGKMYSYGAGYKNLNFDRYYHHNKFSELGFSPYRDNDALYNEKGSWWDDFTRMRGQWTGLAWSGAKSVWGSEVDANEAMEKGMAVGMSSRDGFGAHVTNFGLNTAYTAGILGEMALENAVLSAMETATFGVAAPEAEVIRAARLAQGAGKLTRAWKGIANFITELKSVDKAKNFYDYAKMAGKGAVDLGKWANPLERTMHNVYNLYKGEKGFKDLSNVAKVGITFVDFYKDIRELNLAHSEAKLEGQGASVKYQDQLVDEFYQKNGRMPDLKEAQLIHAQGQNLKTTVTLANDAVIYLSNKIVFENMFNGINPAKTIAKDFWKGTGRKLEATAAKGYKAGDEIVNASNMSRWAKTKEGLFTSALSPISRRYAMANISEALQESSQEIIQEAALDYHKRIKQDPSQYGFYSALGAIGRGTGKQFNAQGLETFLSGYLMGSVIQGGTHVLSRGTEGAGGLLHSATKSSMFKPYGQERKDQKDRQETNQNDAMDAANFIGKNALKFGNSFSSSYSDNLAEISILNKEIKAKRDSGDIKGVKELENELRNVHFMRLAKTDNLDIITEHVDSMLELNDKELTEAYKLQETDAAEVRRKLTGLKDKSKSFKNQYKFAKKSRPNPYDPWKYGAKNEDGSLKYEQQYVEEYARYQAHENITDTLIFSRNDYSSVSDRMAKIGLDLTGQSSKFKNLINTMRGGTPISNAAGSDISLLIDKQGMGIKRTTLKEMIGALKNGTPEQKKEAEQLIKQEELLKDWSQNVTDYRNKMNSKFGAPVSEQEIQESTQRLKDSFTTYLKHLTKLNKGHVFDSQVEEAFTSIKDFYNLAQDQDLIVSTINKLSGGDNEGLIIEHLTKLNKIKDEQELENLNKAFDNFKEQAKQNKMLQELFDLGLFVLPEDIEELKNYHVSDFYQFTGKVKEKIDPTSDLYKKALDVVEKYAKDENKDVSGKATPESRPESKYNTHSRNKTYNDKRTYADYATQFGFDPKSASTDVKTSLVLQAIIKSKYASSAEKMLARRLLTTVKPDSVITFVNDLATPGVYIQEEGKVSQTKVDARYSSNDYSAGERGDPLEVVILHEYMHELTVDGLEKDAEFSKAIEDMLAATRADQVNQTGRPLYGTKNAAEFIAECMSNPTFRRRLQQIPYTVTGKPSNAWDGFMESLRKFFRKFLGFNNTVLDEALNVITKYLDNLEIIKPKITKANNLNNATSKQITVATPIDEMKPELVDKLLEAYHEFNETNGKPKDENAKQDIIASDKFKSFVLESPKSNEIIKKYNGSPENIVPEEIKPEVKKDTGIPLGTAPSPNLIARGIKLGFTKEQIEEMTSQERVDISKATSKADIQNLFDKYNPFVIISPEQSVNDTTNQTGIKQTEIEAKKVDIERRRQEEIKETESAKTSQFKVLKEEFDTPSTKEKRKEYRDNLKNEFERRFKEINAKYDAELTTLEQSNNIVIEEPNTSIITEEDFNIDYLKKYITTLEEYTNWESKMLELLGDSKQVGLWSKKLGITINGTTINELSKIIENSYKTSFTFDTLLPGNIVKLKNSSAKKIISKKIKDVIYLVDLEDINNPTVAAIVVKEKDIHKTIDYKINKDVLEETTPISQQDIEDSNEVIKKAQNTDAATQEIIDASKKISVAEQKRIAAENIKNCKK